MPVNLSLIPATSNPALEAELRDRLARLTNVYGHLGELESLALRLGLLQNTLTPNFQSPRLLLFAADHGLVVEGVRTIQTQPTAQLVRSVLRSQVPVEVFARSHGMELTMVDCGVAEPVAPDSRLIARKIAHGTRNARVHAAMSVDQAEAAIRAGMEIANALAGNAVACAGVGVGSHESAALVISRLTGEPVLKFLLRTVQPDDGALPSLMAVMRSIQHRHRGVNDPVEVLAAMGGFEIAMMAGVMLAAGSKRHLILVDGLPACAALMVAAHIAPAISDYCVFCRSTGHLGVDQALRLFKASALLELGLDCTDGTGAALAFPLVNCAAALLGEVDVDKDSPAAVPQGPQPTSTGDSTL